MSKINIRNATRDDVAFLADCNIAMALESEQKLLAREVLTRGIVAVFDHPERGFYIVAERDGDARRQSADHARMERLAQRRLVVDPERLRRCPTRGAAACLPRCIARSKRARARTTGVIGLAALRREGEYARAGDVCGARHGAGVLQPLSVEFRWSSIDVSVRCPFSRLRSRCRQVMRGCAVVNHACPHPCPLPRAGRG